MQETIRWEISVPILKNTTVLKQLGIALGIPFGLAALILILASGKSGDTLYALGFIAALLILTGLFIMAAYRGFYEAEFVLDQRGVLCRTGTRQAKKNRIINTMAVLFGLLSGKPAAVGAGMLAQSKQAVFIRWNRITKVRCQPKRRTILLRGGWTESIALFCTAENYSLTEQFVLEKAPPVEGVYRA